MPTVSTHPEVQVYSGARWQFNVNLFNKDGSRMDMTNKAVEWAMLDKMQRPVLNSPGDITINKVALGLITIIVTATKTLTVSVGRYTDYLRVDGQDILLEGQIWVKAGPFGVLVPIATFSVGSPTFGTPELDVI